ncbi:Replication factor C subunit 2 [Linum perenne]
MAPVLQSSQPWVEKYRPKQVKDVAHQDEVVRVLTNTLETSNCPHMLFYGPPGTGKTTTALAIAHQLFGPEHYKSRVLELNASDDRGISVVRTKIKDFAGVAVDTRQHNGDYPRPPFKIIILDEADSMTEDAQACSLLYSITIGFKTCRIIEPLASRCAKFRFKPLSEEIMSSRILHICKEEGLFLDDEGAARLYGSSISSKDLINVSGVVPQSIVQSLFASCKNGNFDLANKEVNNVISDGYPVSQMISQLFDIIVEADDITDEQKARVCKSMGSADKCLIDGADEYLQLLEVVSNIIKAIHNMPQNFTYEC